MVSKKLSINFFDFDYLSELFCNSWLSTISSSLNTFQGGTRPYNLLGDFSIAQHSL